MTIKDALQRIKWRFTNGKFEPNQNDIDAFIFIVEWINREKKDIRKENDLFARLYTYALTNEILFYKDLDFAVKNLKDQLKKPTYDHYQYFHKILNGIEFSNFQKEKGICQKHTMLLTADEENLNKHIISQNQKEFEKYLNGIWQYEDVEQNLNNQITECVNKYRKL